MGTEINSRYLPTSSLVKFKFHILHTESKVDVVPFFEILTMALRRQVLDSKLVRLYLYLIQYQTREIYLEHNPAASQPLSRSLAGRTVAPV